MHKRLGTAGHKDAGLNGSQRVKPGVGVVAAFVFLCAVLLAISVVCFSQQPRTSAVRSSSPASDQAKLSFEVHCATCHGLDGRGGEHAPGIVGTPVALARTDDGLARIIRNGIPAGGMPSFHFLTRRQIEGLIRYIRVLGGSSETGAVKGDPAVGAKLFFGKAHCAVCHMMQGKGGFIGSDLSEFGRSHTASEIRQIILQPDKFLVPRWQLVRVVTLSGQHFSGLIRNEDNFSIALQSKDGVFYLFMKSEIARITRERRSVMPDDYGTQLSKSQLDDLVSYLILGSSHKSPQSNGAGASLR